MPHAHALHAHAVLRPADQGGPQRDERGRGREGRGVPRIGGGGVGARGDVRRAVVAAPAARALREPGQARRRPHARVAVPIGARPVRVGLRDGGGVPAPVGNRPARRSGRRTPGPPLRPVRRHNLRRRRRGLGLVRARHDAGQVRLQRRPPLHLLGPHRALHPAAQPPPRRPQVPHGVLRVVRADHARDVHRAVPRVAQLGRAGRAAGQAAEPGARLPVPQLRARLRRLHTHRAQGLPPHQHAQERAHTDQGRRAAVVERGDGGVPGRGALARGGGGCADAGRGEVRALDPLTASPP
mmetsp:Transcript_807/g.2632  ORF Transcript_807/g.2632 Transcript_807/m.2632 type:complete len:297 (+) Transcript_807:767-1657(+)